MRLALRLHPDSLSLAATHIDVDVARPYAGSLMLCYFVTGKIGGLRLPPIAPPGRAEELWRHTCFEAFVRSPREQSYEFNFSPSSQWAAYWFDGYRERDARGERVSRASIAVKASSTLCRLQAHLRSISCRTCGATLDGASVSRR